MEFSKDVEDGRSTGSADRANVGDGRSSRLRESDLRELAREKARLSNRVTVLEHSNAQLEEAAGAVAHDLREGLATISLFLEALAKRLGDGTDSAVARDLEGLRSGIEHMHELVDEETASTRTEGPADSEDALTRAISNLEARRAETEARFVISKLPRVGCGPVPLTRLFQNLLANALASEDSDRELVIEVSARRDGARWRFEVADSGTGIQREATEGNAFPTRRGLGLVICRRIVESHGGSIGAVPREGGGTIVAFDLPSVD